jgi:hypothetical protein
VRQVQLWSLARPLLLGRRDSYAKDKMNWEAIGRYRSLINQAAKAADWASFNLVSSIER